MDFEEDTGLELTVEHAENLIFIKQVISLRNEQVIKVCPLCHLQGYVFPRQAGFPLPHGFLLL